MSTDKPALRVSYWVKPNRYGGKCVACACDVLEGNGWTQRDGDTWQTVCRDCARANARALPVIVNGGPTHVTGLNAKADGGTLYTCCKCHAEVVLVKGRSGKWYFCEIAGGQTGRRYAATHAPHTLENCAENAERWNEPDNN